MERLYVYWESELLTCKRKEKDHLPRSQGVGESKQAWGGRAAAVVLRRIKPDCSEHVKCKVQMYGKGVWIVSFLSQRWLQGQER